ncbi:uncharacterized protein LOC126834732 [Adelges cooleyi]|uniref:uncharacterized protein LOC126834732 n=1 Tax=Adelges cooleyi TaxID=133065 RepID=UPI00217F8332|nr:uncharacterized protein LOC126834732 [Adelges cooleyi]
MPFYKDDEPHFKYSYETSHVVYGDDNSSQSGNPNSGDDDEDDDGGPNAWDTETAGNSDTSSGSTSGSKSVDSTGKGKERGAGRGKWFKKLRMIFDRLQVDEKKEKPRKKVKSILRPPVQYTYVVGMSGITSRVPVFRM